MIVILQGVVAALYFRNSTRNYHRLRCVQIHALDNTDGNTIRARGSLFLAWTRAHSRDLFSLPSQFTFGREKVIGHEVRLFSIKLMEITFNVRRHPEICRLVPGSFYGGFFRSLFSDIIKQLVVAIAMLPFLALIFICLLCLFTSHIYRYNNNKKFQDNVWTRAFVDNILFTLKHS